MRRIFVGSLAGLAIGVASTCALLLCRAKLCAPSPPAVDTVYFGFIKKGCVATKTVVLNVSKQEDIVGYWSDCKHAKVFLTKEEGLTKIKVTLDTRLLPPGQLQGNLYIRLQHSATPLVSLPFVGIVQDASKKPCCVD